MSGEAPDRPRAGTVAVPTRGSEPSGAVDRELVVLAGAKAVSNVAVRWVGPFLPTLERGFGASTATLTGIIGAAELGGLSTLLVGSTLDRGRERLVFAAGLGAVSAASLVALGGSVTTFAMATVLLVMGVSNLTVAGHTWIGHRVAYQRRSRAIGTFEISWALSLLCGAPLLAWLIRAHGWRGPYVALAIGAALAALVVLLTVSSGHPQSSEHPHASERPRDPSSSGPPPARLPRSAWPTLCITPAIAATGLGLFIVSGAWLEDVHDVSTAGLGAAAAGFGAVELLASSSVAALADRIGARRSVVGGLLVVLAGEATMATAADSRVVAIVGLLVFLAGFEYAIVSSLTLITEAAPDARGRAVAMSNALGTLARAAAVAGSGQLYDSVGMRGTLALTSATAAAAIAITVFTRRSRS